MSDPAPFPKKFGSPFRNLLRMRRDPIGFLKTLAAEGDAVECSLGQNRILFINRPEWIHDVLVSKHRSFHKGPAFERASQGLLGRGLLTSEGDEHTRNRRLMQPAFHLQRIKGYADRMVAEAERLNAEWRAGDEIDITDAMHRLTLCIAGRTLFGLDLERDAAEVSVAVRETFEGFPIGVAPWDKWLERLPLRTRAARARQRLDEFIYGLIEQRRRAEEDTGDLLSMLILTRDEDASGFSDKQVHDEAMTLFFAGHETTALVLSWGAYVLAQDPALDERLAAEAAAAAPGRPLTFADLPALPLARNFFAETLRLYPSVWALPRRAVEDVMLGDLAVKAGTPVLFSQFLVHRDPRFWPEPDRFHIDRWTEEEKKRVREQFVYFPFGGGPRICMGEQFAWTEGTLLIAALLRKWRFTLLNERPIGLKPMATLHPSEPVRVRIETR